MDWETAFTGVQKTVDATEAEYEELSKGIQQMATETASSMEEIAGVAEVAGQLGIAKENLLDFTKVMVELGDTTNLSAEEAATSLARFLNITGESTGNVDRLGAAIVDLGNNFATDEAAIVAMSTRLASAGTLAGMTSTDILALSTAMSSVGIEAEAGGTAMTQTLTALEAAVAGFSVGSTEDLEAIASVANMSAADFASAWNTHPIEAVQAFISGLGQLDEKGESATLVLDELGMSGIRQSNMLKSLALASDVLSDAIDTSSTAYQENTALTVEAEKRYGTFESQVSQLKESFKTIAIDIGETLIPIIKSLMESLKGVVEWWKNLSEGQRELIVKAGLLVAALSPVLIIIGKLISTVGTIMTIIPKISAALTAVKGAFAALNAVMLANPIILIIAAIAALVAAFIYLWNNCEEFRQFWIDLWEGIKEAAVAVWEGLKTFFTEAWTAIKTTAETVWTAISTFFTGLWDGIKNTFTTVVTAISTFLQNAWSTISNVVTTMWNGIKNTVTSVMNAISSFISAAWNNIKNTVTNVGNAIKNAVTTVWTNITSAVKNAMSNVFSAVKSGFVNVKDHIVGLASEAFNWGKDLIMGIVNGIKSVIGKVGEAVSDVASTIREFLHFSVPDKGPLTDYESWMPDFIGGLAKGIEQSRSLIDKAMAGITGDMVISPRVLAADGGLAAGGADRGNADIFSGISSAISTALSGNAAAGDIVIPVYLGTDMIDEIVVTAQQRMNLRSGGR
jgi:TP901 family phage tail tape measure protein